MMSYLYLFLLLVSMGSLIYLAQKEYKHADRYLWTQVVIIPIVILGYWFRSQAHTPEAATVALYFAYLDSTVMLIVCFFNILQSIDVTVPGYCKTGVYAVTAAHLFSIWCSKDSQVYYASVEVEETGLGSVIHMTPGPLKVTHYVFLAIVYAAIILALVYGTVKKNGFSRRIFKIYCAFTIAGFVLYVAEMVFRFKFSILPILYAGGSVCIVLNYNRFLSQDIVGIVGEKQYKTGLRGYATFDLKRRLVGYNIRFSDLVPEIVKVGIDNVINIESENLIGRLNQAIDLYINDGIENQTITIDDTIYRLCVSMFSLNYQRKTNGYLVEVEDITEETNQREIIEKYNDVLGKEIRKKTEHIAEIQNTVVLGLANMVENRDDNTGGHVKRTSDVIKILVDEMRHSNNGVLSVRKAYDIVKAAPMHDLGKISIDNSILCKPGKLTDEEFAIMKTHAAKSGEIVKIILEGVEEEEFVETAYKLARHHHERWDGRGYPDGLMGEKIPLEARIMAVADVYDALVSKRCYKAAMDFDTAYRIMIENMGSQFDPAMRPVFMACREKLEAYYTKANQEDS